MPWNTTLRLPKWIKEMAPIAQIYRHDIPLIRLTCLVINHKSITCQSPCLLRWFVRHVGWLNPPWIPWTLSGYHPWISPVDSFDYSSVDIGTLSHYETLWGLITSITACQGMTHHECLINYISGEWMLNDWLNLNQIDWPADAGSTTAQRYIMRCPD